VTPRAAPRPGAGASGSLRVLAGEALAFPTGILAAALITRGMGASGYGLFTLALGVVLWLELSLWAFFGRSTNRLVSTAEDPAAVAATAVRLYLAAGIAVMLGLWLAAGPVARLLGEPRLAVLLRIAALDVPLTALSTTCRETLVALGRWPQRARAAAGRWLTRLALIALAVAAGLGVEAALAACVGATAVEAFLARTGLGLLRRRERAPLRPLLAYSLPLFVYGVGIALYARLDLYVVKALGAAVAEAGIYAAAANGAWAFQFAGVVLTPLLLSDLSRRRAAGLDAEARRATAGALRLVLLSAPFAALAAVEAPGLLRLVYGAGFAAGAPVFRLLLVAAFGHLVLGVAITTVVAAGHPRRAAPLGVAAPVVAIAAHLLVVPRWGMVGAAAVTAAVAAAAALAALAVTAPSARGYPGPASLVRTVFVGGLAAWAATAWPAEGPWLLVELPALSLVAAALLVLSGELHGDELARIASALAPSRARSLAGEAAAWDRVAYRVERRGHYLDRFLARLKRREHLELLRRWGLRRGSGRLLKTDLFEEAMGADALLPALAGGGWRAVGIDGSPAVVARARRRDPEAVAHVVADVRALPFSPGVFDAVLSPSSLDHFLDPTDLGRSLRELRAALAPDGRLAVTLDNRANVTDPLLRLAAAVGLAPYVLGRSYTARELRGELAAAGFDVVAESTLLHNPRLFAAGAAALARRSHSPRLARWVRRRLLAGRRLREGPLRHPTASFVAALAAPARREE